MILYQISLVKLVRYFSILFSSVNMIVMLTLVLSSLDYKDKEHPL